jgi:hypothetical protein
MTTRLRFFIMFVVFFPGPDVQTVESIDDAANGVSGGNCNILSPKNFII